MKSHIMLLELYQLPQTVFTTRELSVRFPTVPYPLLKRRLSYYVKSGKLVHPRRGIYLKDRFDPLELANKLHAPSYISLDTVLRREGIIFQDSPIITAVSDKTVTITAAGTTASYRRAPAHVLFNPQGIIVTEQFAMASRERAFLDALYLYKEHHMDNLRPIDWSAADPLATIYKSHALTRRLREYHQQFLEDHVGEEPA